MFEEFFRCNDHVRPEPSPLDPAVPSIVCPVCGKRSHNPNDVENRYCGHCHKFHDDMPKAT